MKRITTVLIALMALSSFAVSEDVSQALSQAISSELKASIPTNADAWTSFMTQQNVALSDVTDSSVTAGVLAWDPTGGEAGEMTPESMARGILGTFVTGNIGYSTDAEGNISLSGIDAFRRKIASAATKAKAGFNDPGARTAIASQVFPAVYAVQGGYTTQFKKLSGQYEPQFKQFAIEAAALSQKPTSFSADNGPRALVMGTKRVNVNVVSRRAYVAAYEALKSIDKANAYTREQLSQELSLRLVQVAATLVDEDFTQTGETTIDMARLLAGDLTTPGSASYIGQIEKAFEEKLSTLEIAIKYLPDYPVRNQPESGVLIGPISGTHVLFKSPDDSFARIVRLRSPETGEIALMLFMRSGTSIDAYIPSGRYMLDYAKGDEWFGEVKQFGQEAAYASSIVPIEIMPSDKYHVISFGTEDANLDNSVRIPMKSDEYVEPGQ